MADLRNLKRRIGQRFVLRFDGPVLPAELARLDEQWGIGGYLLDQRNFTTFEALMDLIEDLWGHGQGTPPFIGAGESGASMHCLPEPFTTFPALHQVGHVSSVSVSYEVGAVVSRELTAVGINMFQTSLLNANGIPKGFSGRRPFAADCDKAASLSRAMMRGLHDNAILACAMQFPCLPEAPDTLTKSSDLKLDDLKHNLSCFEKIMLSNPRIDLLQMSAARFPKLDPENPPSLSSRLIQDILKLEFGYKGLVMTSDLAEIKGVSAPDAVDRALQAGADLFLIGGDLDTQIAALEKVLEIATTTGYPKHLWEHTYGRIRNFKAEHFRVIRSVDRAHAKELIGNREHQRISRRLKDGK